MSSQQPEILQQLTLDEKIALCSGLDFWRIGGIERLGIPAIFLTDGPHGLRKQADNLAQVDIRGVEATCFPTASATANSWNRELLFAIGSAIGEECLQESVAVVLGPGINIKRSPLCGRNFEYFSEDPLLSGELAAEFIDGVQSRGIGTSLKHFAVNNQEALRNTIDVVVDTRALHEIYLAGFEIAVRKSQPWTVMAAYNKVNGDYCSEHPLLLDTILREQWGFKGLVVSDWGACNDRVAGLQAGMDLEMPSSSGANGEKIRAALQAGTLDMATLDRSVQRILALIAAAAAHQQPNYRYDRELHHRLAQRAAAESAVLFKNDDAILPLQADVAIAVIGAFAEQPRFQGAGSSQITPWRVDNALEACRQHAPGLVYAPGYPRHEDRIDEQLLADAVDAARAATVVVVFAGLTEQFESEGFDREHLRLPDNHNVLIERIAAVNSNVVVVLANGAPVAMPWIDSVRAVLGGFLGGQAGGSAIADLLFGIANPSGKLAETWPMQLEDCPAQRHFPGGPVTVEYRESLFIGYRYYSTVQRTNARQAVLFSFGHGLSYTRFEYSDLQLSSQRIDENEPLTVSIRIGNVGAMAGAEVVQLYVRDIESTAFRPGLELKEFGKCFLKPGAHRTLEFTLHRRAFAYFDAKCDALHRKGRGSQGEWRVETGTFEILIGASSTDIRARATVWVDAAELGVTTEPVALSAYHRLGATPGAPLVVDEGTFAALYGRPLPPTRRPANAPFDLNSTLSEVRRTFIGRRLYSSVLQNMQKVAPADIDPTLSRMMAAVVADMPLRQLVAFSRGRLSFALMEGLLSMMNGRIGRGLRQLLGALRPRR
jgi:beta-glucosidase